MARLNDASLGLSTKESLQQSNCFVFANGRLITFNDEIMVRTSSPLDFDMVVNATDFMGIVSKIPDDEIDVSRRGGEVVVRGKKRKAGIACVTEVVLPVDAVPVPDKWHRLADGALAAMMQAARTCGKPDDDYLSTVVHVTPDRVEACDNVRMFRVDGPTGVPGELLVKAHPLLELEGTDAVKVALSAGWVHFKTAGGAEIALRADAAKYHPDIDAILTLDKPAKVTLPTNLGEIVGRAEVFLSGDRDARIGVRIADNDLVLTARKEGGWYKERKRIMYAGRVLDFEINPKFLVEILSRARDVMVDARKMKIAGDRTQFVVSLRPRETAGAADDAGDIEADGE